MINYASNDNIEALQTMMLEGRLMAGEKGEKVTVVKFGYTKSLVRFHSNGVTGYVPTEKIKDKLVE